MGVLKDKNAKTNPWYYVIEVRENGKRSRIKKRGFRTQKEAKAAYAEAINTQAKGDLLKPSKLLYREYLKQYLETKKTTVKSSTLKTYAWLIEYHIIPLLGDHEIGKLSPAHIQKFYNGLIEQNKLASENVQKIHTLINDSLKRAERWQLVNKNVAALVDRARMTKNQIQVWDKEQSQTFLWAAREDRLYIAFLLALTTGMRQSEILGLRWADVDIENKTLHIVQALSHDGKELTTELTTRNAGRKVAIPGEVATTLKKHKSRQRGEFLILGRSGNNDDLVVSTSLETPVIPRNLMRTFYRLIEKADVPKITFHELRHTHATLLLKENIHQKIVSERLGHADMRITLERYSHLLPDMQRDATDQFGRAFFEAEPVRKAPTRSAN